MALVGLGLLITSLLVFLPRQVTDSNQSTEKVYKDMVRLGYLESGADNGRLWHLLGATDIEFYITGGHGLEVIAANKSQAARAIALIKEDAKKHGYEFVEMPSEPQQTTR